MQKINDKLDKANKSIVTAVLALFILHFMSIHGVANALVVCFEENGNVNVESVAGSFLTIPSEDRIHNEASHDHGKSTSEISHRHHSDVAFSNLCSKEQRTTRFDQQRTLKFLDGILNRSVEDLPRSRAFQFVSFIPPLIEDLITSHLQTIVLLN